MTLQWNSMGTGHTIEGCFSTLSIVLHPPKQTKTAPFLDVSRANQNPRNLMVTGVCVWWPHRDSNSGPSGYEPPAQILTNEFKGLTDTLQPIGTLLALVGRTLVCLHPDLRYGISSSLRCLPYPWIMVIRESLNHFTVLRDDGTGKAFDDVTEVHVFSCARGGASSASADLGGGFYAPCCDFRLA